MVYDSSILNFDWAVRQDSGKMFEYISVTFLNSSTPHAASVIIYFCILFNSQSCQAPVQPRIQTMTWAKLENR